MNRHPRDSKDFSEWIWEDSLKGGALMRGKGVLMAGLWRYRSNKDARGKRGNNKHLREKKKPVTFLNPLRGGRHSLVSFLLDR